MWVPGAGGFGGNRNIPGVENPPVTPTSSPDVTVTEKISNDQVMWVRTRPFFYYKSEFYLKTK